MSSQSAQDKELAQIIASAQTLGVEMDEEEAIQWLTAVAAAQSGEGSEVAIDERTGVFGHRVALLDFDPGDLERLRRVAAILEIPDRENVETAIALSGSAAQGNVQTFPGDFDFLERVNIKAATRDEACRMLGQVIRDKALSAGRGPGFQLTEVRFGSYRQKAIRGDEEVDVGGSIIWSPAEVEDGHFDVLLPGGESMTIDWDYACQDPGWCKFDYVVLDPGQPRAVKSSNMLDATWEAPDGHIEALDGFIDPYFQEVYLDAEAIPVFSKIMEHLSPNALQQYVEQLEGEVRKYTHEGHANFGKAAKRMYNVFRLTGRFEEAAFVRELFDEPAALLYQVGALLDGYADMGGSEGQSISRDTMLQQVDDLIEAVTASAEGPLMTELVMSLIRLRDDVTGVRPMGDTWVGEVRDMQDDVTKLVNQFFAERLNAIPQVRLYIESLH